MTWAVSGSEGVKGGASGDMWLECAQELVFSYYRFKLVIGGRERHVLDDSGGVVWTLLPGV